MTKQNYCFFVFLFINRLGIQLEVEEIRSISANLNQVELERARKKFFLCVSCVKYNRNSMKKMDVINMVN